MVQPQSYKELYAAVEAGETEKVKLLLNSGADLDWVNKEDAGMTAVIKACSLGNCACTQLLVAGGAKLGVVSEWGVTALSVACCIGYEDCVKLLIGAGAPLETRGRGVSRGIYLV
jgi:ankyrin repeat protein